MKSTSLAFNREAAKLVDTQSIRVAVDIGGASGTLIHSLMKENPALQGVVFDLPHVVPTAIKAAEDLGLQDRFSVVAGDFFATAPPPADLFLLKLILHDWNDEACLSILKNCRRTINPGGRILVVESLIDEIGTPGFAPILDMTCWSNSVAGSGIWRSTKLCLLQQAFVFPAPRQLRHRWS